MHVIQSLAHVHSCWLHAAILLLEALSLLTEEQDVM